MDLEETHLPRSRTLAIRNEMVRQLRVERGWSVFDLALRANCSEKTIANVENGKRIYLATLSRIAKALAVEPRALLAETIEVEPARAMILPQPTALLKINIVLDMNMSFFDETQQLLALIERLAVIAGPGGEINVDSIKKSSVVVTQGQRVLIGRFGGV